VINLGARVTRYGGTLAALGAAMALTRPTVVVVALAKVAFREVWASAMVGRGSSGDLQDLEEWTAGGRAGAGQRVGVKIWRDPADQADECRACCAALNS
jgi:hypothetical protein